MYSKLLQQILSGFGLLTGASYPFQTLALFWRSPSLLPYIIIPLLLNIGLGIFLYWQLFSWEQNTIEIILINSRDQWQIIYNQLPTWLQGIEILIQVLFWVVKLFLQLATLILTGFILAQIGVLLGAPWYGRLSEKLEFLRLGKCYIQEVGFVQEIQRAIAFELKKLVIIIGLGFPCFLFNFFPGIGPLIATIGGITITTTLTCLDFLDQPLERRRLSFRAKLGMIIKSLPSSGGFGLTCLGLVSIPLVNLVTIPLCVAAGTLFFSDRLYPRYFAELESQFPTLNVEQY
jgi:CysZ protein